MNPTGMAGVMGQMAFSGNYFFVNYDGLDGWLGFSGVNLKP